MSTAFKLKLVDVRSKIIVFGYIRRIEEVFADDQEIPKDIKHLCVLYFYETEEFDRYNHNLKVSSSSSDKHNDMVEQISGGCWYCVFGKIIIDPMNFPSSVYIWRLRLIASELRDFSPSIGIVEAGIDHSTGAYCFAADDKRKHQYYCYATRYGEKEASSYEGSYGPESGLTDKLVNLITMKFDIAAKALSFSLNNEDLGVAYKDIDTDKTYRFAISFAETGYKAQLLSFMIK